jgi:hypothetical protein
MAHPRRAGGFNIHVDVNGAQALLAEIETD